jgi:membrane-bound metal-dependent hydrolase YbcI (DUF457 family)
MPFTLAHPAAVLVLRHVRYLRTAPLIVGAMTPDLPYYFSEGLSGHVLRMDTHSLVGSYMVDLPLGLAILICMVLLREPLTVLLPARSRWLCLHALEPFSRSAREWLFAPFAIQIGVWSHVLWDSFTHSGTWAVRRFPALGEPVTIGSYTGQISHILQYASSGVGLAIVVWWYARLRVPGAAHVGHDARRARAGPALLLVAGAALLIGGVEAVLYYRHSDGAIYRTIDTFLTRGLAWFVVLDLFAGTVVELEHRAAAPGPQ